MGGGCVVVAVDRLVRAPRAVEWAAREAARRGTSLRIVSVPVIPSLTRAREGAPSAMAGTPRAAAAGVIRAAAGQATRIVPGLPVDVDVLTGAPALAVAHAGSGASMLVLGSHGDGDFEARILGSVTEYAAANARCPIVVVHDHSPAVGGEVVVGIRDPDACDQLLSFAFEEAALRDASLLAVHAWHWFAPVPPIAGDPVIDPGLIPVEARDRVAGLLTVWRQKYPAVQVTGNVVRGDPGRVLSGLSAKAELVVLGRHARNAIRRSVLDHARGPVAFVPD